MLNVGMLKSLKDVTDHRRCREAKREERRERNLIDGLSFTRRCCPTCTRAIRLGNRACVRARAQASLSANVILSSDAAWHIRKKKGKEERKKKRKLIEE